MIEFRYVIFLALWTLLIGPVIDLAQNSSKAQPARAKTAHTSTVRTNR